MGTRRRLAGQLAGEHRSPRHGSSLDFADYRTYHPGDDFRRIDYHLYARLDTLLLKLYEAEDEVRLRLLIDTSASMGRGGKLAQAARVAGALGFVALVRRDPVTLHTFPLEGAAPRFELCPGLLETRWYAAAGVPAFAYGPGRLEVSHGPDEHVEIDALIRCATVYALTIRRLLGRAQS